MEKENKYDSLMFSVLYHSLPPEKQKLIMEKLNQLISAKEDKEKET